jgi:RNA polymerase sigma-70 factor (ECF subfamily)
VGDVKDAESFDAFYTQTRTRLLHQMYAMTGNSADAQEVLQEAYARAWQRWSTVQGYDNPEAWVRTVAWRIAASRWRKAKNAVVALARHGAPEPVAAPTIHNVALVAALKQIPEAQRRAVVLHHLCGLSVEEVAAETDAPTGTVKARLSRGRAALAALLGDEAPADPALDRSAPSAPTTTTTTTTESSHV